jgi:fused-like protein
VVGILYLPFANQDAIDEPVMGLVSQQLLDNSIVAHLISALPRLPPDYVELPTGLLSRLILGDPQFATQFSEGGGLVPTCTHVLFSERNAIGVVVDALLMVSQLARASSENYERLHQADLYPAFYRLLQHPDSNVRAKMCNLLGNLCKHSAYFYSHLKKYVTTAFSVAFVVTIVPGTD